MVLGQTSYVILEFNFPSILRGPFAKIETFGPKFKVVPEGYLSFV